MNWSAERNLSVWDQCCESFTFPMLDNGYVYLAATRLSLFRSPEDWAMVIEVFSFSPRAGLPDLHLHTFGSRLRSQKSEDNYVSREAYETYLAGNPNNESTFLYPIEDGDWIDVEDPERLAEGPRGALLRGLSVSLPEPQEYTAVGIELQDAPKARVFEFCRWLAASQRDRVLATAEERRVCVPPELEQLMLLEEWHHPNLAEGEVASSSATFRSLAEVLASGNVSLYKPSIEPNNHWRHWPDGGSL
jgi:hypothetical protein